MSNEPYSVTSSQSWGSRLMESIKGVAVGGVLFIAAFPVLWMNEGCAVDIAKGLEEGASKVVAIDVNTFSNDSEGKLIHGSGQATTSEKLMDSSFGVNLNAIKLERTAEMYQWKENSHSETKEKLGGSKETVTTYSYEQGWSPTLINSDKFNDPQARSRNANPKVMPYKSETWVANKVNVGAYPISKGLTSQISANETVDYTKVSIPTDISRKSKISSDEIYIGNPASPKVGDIKISHKVANPQEVSILGKVNSGMVGPFKTERDTVIERLQTGNHSAADMFAAAESENVTRTWIVRVGGFFMFFIGIGMILKPISTLGAVVPFIGNLLGFGLNLVAGVISFILTFIVIAIAWIFFRPLLGIFLLAVAGAGVYFLLMKKKQADAKADATGTPSPQAG